MFEVFFVIYVVDFDENGILDMVLIYYYEGKEYFFYGWSVMQDQLVSVKKVYLFYIDYVWAMVQDIFIVLVLVKV